MQSKIGLGCSTPLNYKNGYEFVSLPIVEIIELNLDNYFKGAQSYLFIFFLSKLLEIYKLAHIFS